MWLAGGLLLLGAPGFASISELEAWDSLRRTPAAIDWATAERHLREVYLPKVEGAAEWIRAGADGAMVRPFAAHEGVWLELPWTNEQDAAVTLPVRGTCDPGRPLAGFRIAVDPGHIGGEWGPMERRSFRLGDGPVVQEGDLVLATAQRLAAILREEGAEVLLLRADSAPVTALRPEAFYAEAFTGLLASTGQLPEADQVRRQAEIRFYRRAEIEARAERVAEWKPHFVLALHLDAAAWPDPEAPSPVTVNHGHILLHGCYLPAELQDDGQRAALVRRWRRGDTACELSLGQMLAEAMAEHTGLPPFRYRGPNAAPVGDHPYLWARNLLANRTYAAPVIYLEPWVLNHDEIYAWAGLGDYEGEREVTLEGAAVQRPSLPAVYADFVADGVRRWAEASAR